MTTFYQDFIDAMAKLAERIRYFEVTSTGRILGPRPWTPKQEPELDPIVIVTMLIGALSQKQGSLAIQENDGAGLRVGPRAMYLREKLWADGFSSDDEALQFTKFWFDVRCFGSLNLFSEHQPARVGVIAEEFVGYGRGEDDPDAYEMDQWGTNGLFVDDVTLFSPWRSGGDVTGEGSSYATWADKPDDRALLFAGLMGAPDKEVGPGENPLIGNATINWVWEGYVPAGPLSAGSDCDSPFGLPPGVLKLPPPMPEYSPNFASQRPWNPPYTTTPSGGNPNGHVAGGYGFPPGNFAFISHIAENHFAYNVYNLYSTLDNALYGTELSPLDCGNNDIGADPQEPSSGGYTGDKQLLARPSLTYVASAYCENDNADHTSNGCTGRAGNYYTNSDPDGGPGPRLACPPIPYTGQSFYDNVDESINGGVGGYPGYSEMVDRIDQVLPSYPLVEGWFARNDPRSMFDPQWDDCFIFSPWRGRVQVRQQDRHVQFRGFVTVWGDPGGQALFRLPHGLLTPPGGIQARLAKGPKGAPGLSDAGPGIPGEMWTLRSSFINSNAASLNGYVEGDADYPIGSDYWAFIPLGSPFNGSSGPKSVILDGASYLGETGDIT